MKKRKKADFDPHRNDSTILRDPAYWRMKAELDALKDLISRIYIESISYERNPKFKINQNTKLYKKLKKDFNKKFKELIEFHHGRILAAWEDVSPAFAANIDNRGMDEIHPDA